MKPQHQAEQYYRLIVTLGGLILFAFGTINIPNIVIPVGILLILALFSGFLVQFPIKLLYGEICLVQIMALGGGFIVGPAFTAWAITLGMIAGYIIRWLVREKRTWRYLLQLGAWLKISYEIALICIPLIINFMLFGFSAGILTDPDLDIWRSGLLVMLVFGIMHGGLYLGRFFFSDRTNAYPKLQSDMIYLLAIEILSIPFILLIVEIYTDVGLKSLALLGGATTITAYLLFKMNSAQIEHEQRVRELSTLNLISQSLRSNLDLDDLLPVIEQQVMQLLAVDNIYLALFDPTSNNLWYPLAVKYGERQNWPRRAMADRLTDQSHP